MTVLPQLQTADSTQALPHLRRSQARTIGIASIIWAASIFLSRIMGLLREQIIGRTLGASREADLYFASFTLPDFLNYLLAAGALSIVFIPIFVEYLERNDRDGGWKALSVIANFLLVVGTIGIAQRWVGLKRKFPFGGGNYRHRTKMGRFESRFCGAKSAPKASCRISNIPSLSESRSKIRCPVLLVR